MTIEEIKEKIAKAMEEDYKIKEDFDLNSNRKNSAAQRWATCKWVLNMLNQLEK